MSEEKKLNEEKALSEEELNTVAGGASTPKTQTGVCSVCNEIVIITASRLPTFGRCPRCGKEAIFNQVGYKFM